MSVRTAATTAALSLVWHPKFANTRDHRNTHALKRPYAVCHAAMPLFVFGFHALCKGKARSSPISLIHKTTILVGASNPPSKMFRSIAIHGEWLEDLSDVPRCQQSQSCLLIHTENSSFGQVWCAWGWRCHQHLRYQEQTQHQDGWMLDVYGRVLDVGPSFL